MKMNKIVQKFQKVENVFFLTMKSGEEMCTFFAKKIFSGCEGDRRFSLLRPGLYFRWGFGTIATEFEKMRQ
jgi:hypothetical protein